MTQNFGHARIDSKGMIYGFDRSPSYAAAQMVVQEQNEFTAEYNQGGDRWIVAEVREYKAPPTSEEIAEARRARDAHTMHLALGEKMNVPRGEHEGKLVQIYALLPGLVYGVRFLDENGRPLVTNDGKSIVGRIPKADLEP